jgi:hypothetical protein
MCDLEGYYFLPVVLLRSWRELRGNIWQLANVLALGRIAAHVLDATSTASG